MSTRDVVLPARTASGQLLRDDSVGGVRQQAAQLLASALQSRRDGAACGLHDFRDLSVEKAFDIRVVERHPKLLGQCLHRGFDLLFGNDSSAYSSAERQSCRGPLCDANICWSVISAVAYLAALAASCGNR